MYNDENKSSSLAQFLNGYDYVMIDTCSLMEDSFPAFMDILDNAKDYLRDGLHIQIISKCMEELKKHSKNRHEDSTRIEAKRALKILKQVKRKKIFEFTKKERHQNFADNVIYTTVSNLRIRYKVLIITQDKGLASDLKNLNDLNSQLGKPVAVYKLVPGGTLEVNKGETGYFFRNHDAAPQSGGSHQYDRRSFGERHKKPNPKEAKPQAAPTVISDLETRISAGDKALSANLNNPNYSKDQKLKDIDEQLTNIAKLPEERKMAIKLLLNDARLHEEKTKLIKSNDALHTPTHGSPKKGEKPVVEKKETAPKMETLAPQEKPTPVKPIAGPVTFVSAPKKLWYEEGRTLQEALVKVATHYGIIFRDPSIAYVPQVHGPADLTSADIAIISDKLTPSEGQPQELLYKGTLYKAEKVYEGYKAYIDLKPDLPPAPSKPHIEEKKEAKAPSVHTARRSPAKKAVAAPAEEAAKPSKVEPSSAPATLIVGIPSDKRKRDAIERRSRVDAMKGTSLSIAKPNSSAKPTKPQPEKKAQKAQQPVKGSAKPERKPAAKPANKPAVKPAPSKPAAPHKEKAAPKKDLLAEAIANEKKLMSNIQNPNFSKPKRLEAIKAQIALMGQLTAEQRLQLKYSIDALKAMATL